MFYRSLFALAAVYNLSFGLWGALDPGGFARVLELPAMNYPSIWGCLAMVVGLYGVLYGYVAWKPDDGDLIIAVGLVGKVLGPIGLVMTIGSGELPPRALALCLFNDLIWWYPFAAYLLRKSEWQRSAIVMISVVFHVAACLGLLIVGAGTELEPDLSVRQKFVTSNLGLWTGVWITWILSSLGLVATCVAWTTKIFELTDDRGWRMLAIAGCAIVTVGAMCDLLGEWLLVAKATLPEQSLADFAGWIRSYQLVSPGVANGLYCVGGLMLSGVSWRLGWITGWFGMLGVAMWSVGLVLTLAAFLPSDTLMTSTGAGVMLLFLPFATWLAWELRIRIDIRES